MKQVITILLLTFSLYASAQKDTVAIDSTKYINEIQIDLTEAKKAVYGKVTQEQFDLIQQYNALVVQFAMNRKKKRK